MDIGFLGPLQVEGADSLRPRTRTVLAALGVNRGDVVSADRLADAVWGDSPPSSWAKQIQICIWDLRRRLGPEEIETLNGGYRLSTCGDRLDVDRFEALIGRGRAYAETGEPDRAASTFVAALALWRGSPFDDLDGWAPGRVEAARLEELYRTTREDLLEARLTAGEHRTVVADAEACVAEEPLRERRWSLLALAQYRAGNQGDALRTLGRARQTLVEALGVDPGSDLIALEAAVLRQDPTLDGSDSRVVSPRCPYKGLAPYDTDDTDTFFGRGAEIVQCVERLSKVRLLVLAGPSGCGKSSLVRAGIVPVLRERKQHVVVVVPGADPDKSLTTALASTPADPVVVVDQLEELFAGQLTPAAIRQFCARIAAYANERAPVIVTIRSDHLGNLAAEPTLARLVQDGLHLVTPLVGDALRATIEGPAFAAGLKLEPGLVELLISETEDEPGALPLLSHALAEAWERRDGRVITVDGYRATGGIRGAVARSAEQLYDSLPTDHQAKLRAIVLRLVAPSMAGDPIRAHIDIHRLDPTPDQQRIVDLLADARLVTTDGETVQLAHEALARAWPRLRGWLDDDVAGQRILRHLSSSAAEWESLGRPASELYRGARLASVLGWRDSANQELTPVEAEFIDASAAAAESERLELEHQSHRQARQNRRLRWTLGAAASLLTLALVAGAVALHQRQEAREAGAVALEQRQQARDGQRESAVSALIGNASTLRSSRRDLAALLAIEAHRIAPSATSESALFGTFTAAPGLERTVHTGIALSLTVGSAEYLTDGRTIVLGDSFGGVHLIDLSTQVERVLPALSEQFGWPIVDVASDGRYLAAAWRPLYEPETGLLTVWDLESERQRFAPITIPFRIGDVALSADGSTVVASGGIEGRALIFDGATGEQRADIDGLPRPGDPFNNVVVTAGLAFAPDGQIALGSQAGVIRFVDPTTGAETRRIAGSQGTSSGDIFFSGDGGSMVVTGEGMERFDLATGEPMWVEPGSPEQCNSYAVAELIGAVLCGEWSGRVISYDLASGTEIGPRFDSQLGDVCALSVSSDGTRLAEVAGCNGEDATVLEWRLDGGGPVSRRVTETPAGDRWVDQFNDELLVAVYSEVADGPPITHVIDPFGTSPTQVHPGVYGFGPTDDQGVVVVLFNDGVSTPTVGLYAADRRQPVGPTVDPGILVDDGWWDGEVLMVAGRRPDEPWRLRTVDLASGALRAPSFDLEEENMDQIAIDHDEFYAVYRGFADGANVNTIQRRSLGDGSLLAESTEGYFSLALGGGVLVGATIDGFIAELDPDTLEVIGTRFPGTSGAVGNMAIDAAGRRLMIRAHDDSLRFYDIPTRVRLGDPIDTDTPFANAALRSDGLAAAAITRLGIVAWDLDPAHWDAAACAVAGRDLTRDEWDQYIGDLAPYAPTCADFS